MFSLIPTDDAVIWIGWVRHEAVDAYTRACAIALMQCRARVVSNIDLIPAGGAHALILVFTIVAQPWGIIDLQIIIPLFS